MAPRIKAIIKSELLTWAREGAGFSLEEAAKKAHVKPEHLERWEKGEEAPSIPQLRKLGNVYKRPLAVFYLPESPRTFDAMRDFRRLPEAQIGHESPELRLEIRKAQYRRIVAMDLYQWIDVIPPEFALTASLSESPEDLAIRIREHFGITHQVQMEWKSHYEAFYGWRSALEKSGVMVFQAKDIDVREMRGFSISGGPLPAVVVNVKDAPTGRIFTMMHEFVHLMLNMTGLCDTEIDRDGASDNDRVEIFCNKMAGAILVPQRDFLAEPSVLQKGTRGDWKDEEIVEIAKRYHVSREVILRRLLTAGLISQSFYRSKREELKKKPDRPPPTKGFAPPDRMAVSCAGHSFVRLVLSGFDREKITSSDLSEYLGVKLKHISKIRRAVYGQPLSLV